jgi:CHAT domain-containing protein
MSYQPPLGVGEEILLQPLSAAAIEAAFVSSQFPRGRELLGDEATKTAVLQRLSDYPVLHFATHGYLSEEAPLLSSILLAHGESLSLYELMGLQLDADLVVLSACDTARGERTGGDDVVGLTRGLLGAGAGAAVVSLWPVNDASTSLLMGHFYRHLRAGDTPVIALQAAQKYLRSLVPDEITVELDLLKAVLEDAGASETSLEPLNEFRDARYRGASTAPQDYSHPFYWAPFILVGTSHQKPGSSTT